MFFFAKNVEQVCRWKEKEDAQQIMGNAKSSNRFIKKGEITDEGIQHLVERTSFRKDEIIDWYNNLQSQNDIEPFSRFKKITQNISKRVSHEPENDDVLVFIFNAISKNPDFVEMVDLAYGWICGDDINKLCIAFHLVTTF
ncbi:hypothetical protein ACOME3_009845 [Neoechinorhynchus agilis]